jgi:hypothetical protein
MELQLLSLFGDPRVLEIVLCVAVIWMLRWISSLG